MITAMNEKKLVYLDHAAATPMDETVISSMHLYFAEVFSNPSALYSGGVIARRALDEARRLIAQAVFARPQEIVFADGGTEANNLAIVGTVRHWQQQYPNSVPKIVTTPIEHSSVLEACRSLGAEVIFLAINEEGFIDPRELRLLIDDRTVLVTIGMANNEIGVIQDIRGVAKELRHYRKHTNSEKYPLLHTDAVQALNYLDIDVRSLGADMLTIAGSKIYGPKKIAALYVSEGVSLLPIIYGGEQEKGLRPGTENVASIVGFAKAVAMATQLRSNEASRLLSLRTELVTRLLAIPMIAINGCKDGEHTLPNIVNFSIEGVTGEELLLRLDARGFAVATQSACSSSSYRESHVLRALYPEVKDLNNSLRVSMGRATLESDMDDFVENLTEIVAKMRISKQLFT